jgi:hypothetical protein
MYDGKKGKAKCVLYVCTSGYDGILSGQLGGLVAWNFKVVLFIVLAYIAGTEPWLRAILKARIVPG